MAYQPSHSVPDKRLHHLGRELYHCVAAKQSWQAEVNTASSSVLATLPASLGDSGNAKRNLLCIQLAPSVKAPDSLSHRCLPRGGRLGAREAYYLVVDGHIQPPHSAADKKLGHLGREPRLQIHAARTWHIGREHRRAALGRPVKPLIRESPSEEAPQLG